VEPQPLISRPPFDWRESVLRLLADGAFALARFAPPLTGGLTWQDWAYRMMTSLGSRKTQGPGSLHLFGYPSASGMAHELDAAGILDVPVVLEAKDQAQGVSKEHVDSFDGRTLDYFEGAVQHGFTSALYRMMWSTKAIDVQVRRYAARRGIILVGPDKVPLPSLLAAASRWDAVDWYPDKYLGDLVLLAERACRPLRVSALGKSLVCLHPLTLWTSSDLDDLDDLHDLASVQWLDWLDKTDPLHYERCAEHCLHLIFGWKELRYPIVFYEMGGTLVQKQLGVGW
jgi:hypothetical protein